MKFPSSSVKAAVESMGAELNRPLVLRKSTDRCYLSSYGFCVRERLIDAEAGRRLAHPTQENRRTAIARRAPPRRYMVFGSGTELTVTVGVGIETGFPL